MFLKHKRFCSEGFVQPNCAAKWLKFNWNILDRFCWRPANFYCIMISVSHLMWCREGNINKCFKGRCVLNWQYFVYNNPPSVSCVSFVTWVLLSSQRPWAYQTHINVIDQCQLLLYQDWSKGSLTLWSLQTFFFFYKQISLSFLFLPWALTAITCLLYCIQPSSKWQLAK